MCKYKYYHNDKYITYTDTNRNMCANTNRRKAVGTICFSVVSDMSFCYTTIQPIYPAIHNNMSLCYTHRPTIPASFALLPLSARYIYIYGFYGGCLAFGISLESIFWGSFTQSSSPFHFSVYQCVLLGDSLCVRPASPQGHTKGNIGAPNQHFAIGEHSAKWEHQFCHFPIGDHSGEWENQFCLSDCEKGYSSKMMFRSRGKYLIYFLQGKHGQPSLLDLFY